MKEFVEMLLNPENIIPTTTLSLLVIGIISGFFVIPRAMWVHHKVMKDLSKSK